MKNGIQLVKYKVADVHELNQHMQVDVPPRFHPFHPMCASEEIFHLPFEDLGEDEEISLAGFLEKVSLVADADEIPEGEDHGGVVTMMTLHTAKGLEFHLHQQPMKPFPKILPMKSLHPRLDLQMGVLHIPLKQPRVP